MSGYMTNLHPNAVAISQPMPKNSLSWSSEVN